MVHFNTHAVDVQYQNLFVLGAYLQEWRFLENGRSSINLPCLVLHGIPTTTLAPTTATQAEACRVGWSKATVCTYLSL